MTFAEIRVQVVELLQREGRVAYRALKRQFALDDEYLEDLKADLIDAKRVAVDEDGKVLVWVGASPVSGSKFQVSASQSPDSGPRTPDSGLSSGERRQLTVMFCDLVGSTALSARLDPKELREVMQAYQHACVAVITRFDGHVAKYLGDGLLVYFGYPTAHEDDAARAVRAGLGIVAAMQELPLPNVLLQQPLQVRIGIHTGLVVAGEMGSGEYREQLAIVGETPNIAARLQEQALPNSVVISPTTSHLVTGLFACQDLGPQPLKGLSTPLTVYRVVRESEAQSRFEVAVTTGLTPLVGREHEVGLLQERWTRATQGAGQVVLLSGEAGIGKSRLVQTLKEQVMAEGATRIEFHCSPYHQNSAFYPIIEHLQRLLQFAPQDAPQAKLDKLAQRLTPYRFPQADTLPLLAVLLSLPHPEGAPPITLSPQKQKQKTQEAVVAWVVEEAEKAAVYCAWEDLHWVDPSTLEFLTLFLDQVPTARLLVLLTFRPDFTPPWGPRSYLSQLTLSRLGRPQVEAMVGKVTGDKTLPLEVMQQIVAKTDGVPLFVEELTKMVLESGLLTAGDDHYELTGPLPPLAIPSTLQDSLMARLDRLATTREIAQLGATLGREFSYELIHAISPVDEGTLQQGLRQLVDTELVYQRGVPPQATYLFKHALVQDTAYQSLLKSRRQQLHQQIGQMLAEQFPETAETQPELLAHHYTEASLKEQAIPYWQQAGQRAIQRSAHVEAISHLTTGIELLKTLPETPEHTQQALTLYIALGAALLMTKGQGAPEVEHAYTQARALCQQVGETLELIPVLYGLWRFYVGRAQFHTARELRDTLLRLAQGTQDPTLSVIAHHALGATWLFLGALPAARLHLEEGIARYTPDQHRALVFRMGSDLGGSCRINAALLLWLLGYPDQALARVHDALTFVHELSPPYSLAYTRCWAAYVYQFRWDVPAVHEQAEAAVALSIEQGFPFWAAAGTILRGWALAMQGQGEAGMAQVRQGIAAYRATGAALLVPYYCTLLAEVSAHLGHTVDGLQALAEAHTLVEQHEERWWEAEVSRLRGVLLLRQTGAPQEAAEAWLQRALDVARRQEAKSLELRAAMSLARLWQQQDKKKEARQMLAEIYNWFTEGFDTKDLREAKALLEELKH